MIDLGVIAPASTYRLRFPLLKDGAEWTGIDSATATLEKADQVTRIGPVALVNETTDPDDPLITGDHGVWYYDTLVTDIPDEAASEGYWTVKVRAIDGTLDVTYPEEISFFVKRQP